MEDTWIIEEYGPADEKDIVETLCRDTEWEILTNDKTLGTFREALAGGVTYVCRRNGVFCGFVRGVLDRGLAVYISELYVRQEWRNKGVGEALVETFRERFPTLRVYALSDEDAYYEKKGYERRGSVFQIC